MFNWFHRIILNVALQLMASSIIFSQSQPHSIHEFKPLPALPSKISTSIFKDSRGFMWFGTDNGLYRYDGYKFRLFQHNPLDSTTISGNMIWGILFEDVQGDLWIGTVADGLNIYNPETETFNHFIRERKLRFEFDFNSIFTGLQDRYGTTWLVSSTAAGLIDFDKETGGYETYITNTTDTSSWDNRITSLFEDRRGNLMIGTYTGMFIFDNKTKTFTKLDALVNIPEELTDIPVEDIVEDSDGIFWVGSNAGLIKYDILQNKVDLFKHDEKDPKSLSTDLILNVFNNPLDSGKTLWVITHLGINKFDKQTGLVTRYSFDPEDPLNKSFDAVFDAFLDANGILWAATGFAGVVTYDLRGNPFTDFTIGPFDNDPYRYEATAFLHDKEGYFWVGTGFGGLLKYDQNMNLVDRYIHKQDDSGTLSYYFVYSLFEDSDGVLWIGTAASLDVLDKQNNRVIRCTLPEDINYSFTRINEVYQDCFGALWIAATGGAYYQVKKSILDTSFRKARMENDPLLEIRCIAEDLKRNLYLGSTTGHGLYLLTPENRDSMAFINYRYDPADNFSISDDIVWSLWANREGYVWSGTSDGLNRFDPETKTFRRFNKNNGLKASVIYNIKEDNRGDFWLSTESGIVYFKVLTDSTAFSQILERGDGVPFDGNYHFKIYKNPDGKMYVGGGRYTGNGFYSFDPLQLRKNEIPPPMVLTELTVKNKPAELDTAISELHHLKLKHHQNSFSFGFAALDFVNPAKNSFAYKLEGFDEEWIYSGNHRLANYTNIPPGEYIFRVKGSNNDGVWNEKGTFLQISIASPPWNTWWAYSLYVLSVIIIFYIILQVYLNRQKIIHRLELKHFEAEKLDELNREKSKFFANISHEFRTPLTLIIGPINRVIAQIKDENIREELGMTIRNARRLQNLINQMLSLAKLESGTIRLQARPENIVSLVRGYFQSFESAAREKGIELRFDAELDDIQIYIDRDKMEKILYNLFSNALKFTGEGGSIAVKVSSKQSAVNNELTADSLANCTTITITDTGTGIAPEHLPRIFDRFYQVNDTMTREQEGTGIGLALVKELVELHHGSIEVDSELYKGTIFVLTFPSGKEHLDEDELIKDDGVISDHKNASEEIPVAVTAEYFTDINRVNVVKGFPAGNERPIVLIVEDNADMRTYLRSCLADEYGVQEAGNGEKGLEKALNSIPDLVITDVMMPGMDGYELCRRLKSDEKTSHIPVILLTARATLESKIEGLETGADDFVSKPFDALELQVRVRNLINQRKKLTERFMKNALKLGLSKILTFPETGMTSIEDKFLQRSVEVVYQHLADPDFGVVKFSDQMAMNRSQLYRKLHALTDLSPNEFIRFARLHKAAEMISRHTANIAEIAYDVGFNNPSYFAECFRKEFGVLPSEYK